MAGQVSAETFPANVGGTAIYCLSPEDALAIKKAGDILDDLDGGSYARELIEHLGNLLRWYGLHRASRTLEVRHLRPPA